MDLSPYVDRVRDGVTNAAALADDNTRQIAERLGDAVDSSARLALIAALGDAAAGISAEIAPASVEVRLSGGDPEFVVTLPPTPGTPTDFTASAPAAGPRTAGEPDETVEDDDEPLARVTLRLPASIKTKVDEEAARDGISVNAWLIRAVADALAVRSRPEPPAPPWGAGLFGNNGPFGPNGVFGPNGPFGDSPGDRRPRRPRDWGERDHAAEAGRWVPGPDEADHGPGYRKDRGPRERRGGVQGWAR